MIIIESFSTALLLLVVTMFCWGSWANTQKLATSKWPFQLFYWDYTLGIVFAALLIGITMGSYGEDGRSFIEDLQQANGTAFGSALLGGVIFNLANLLLVAAIDIAGMAVAFPIGIGIALVLGVIVNYAAESRGNPYMLFGGVILVLLAIILNAIAYKKLPNSNNKSSRKGILLSLAAGVLMGFFFRFVAASMSMDFCTPEIGLFTPYSALFIFGIGILLSNFLWNTIFMYKPIKGPVVPFKDYISQGNWKLHSIGLLGGLIWCIGMGFSLIATEQAGPAISYGLGQGATMVAAAWGVFIWKEFEAAKKQTRPLISMMFLLFAVGIGLIIVARLDDGALTENISTVSPEFK